MPVMISSSFILVQVKCLGNEAKYIVRALQGKLRIGTAAQVDRL